MDRHTHARMLTFLMASTSSMFLMLSICCASCSEIPVELAACAARVPSLPASSAVLLAAIVAVREGEGEGKELSKAHPMTQTKPKKHKLYTMTQG